MCLLLSRTGILWSLRTADGDCARTLEMLRRYRGVSKKKGRWEAKVMVNRKWAYRELFDSEREAACAYDAAVWRLKPGEAKSYVNFKARGAATPQLQSRPLWAADISVCGWNRVVAWCKSAGI